MLWKAFPFFPWEINLVKVPCSVHNESTLCPPKTKTTVYVEGSFLGYTVFTKEKILSKQSHEKILRL